VITLVNPKSAKWKHRIPLSILSLAAALEDRHEYRLVDGNVERDLGQAVSASIREKGGRYLGVSVMPGPQLGEAIHLSRQIKALHPQVKTIWGGYFPSLHTDVTLQSGFVDYVIRGEADQSLPLLLNSLDSGNTTHADVPNLSYRDGARVVHNPKGIATHPNELRPLPYDRLRIERYLQRTCLGSRTVVYHSSFGCPFLCGFCAVAGVYKGLWMGRDAAAIVRDVLELRERYRVNAVEFIDNNFFVAEKRTAEVAAGLRGQQVSWWGEARPDTVMHYSDSTLRKMAEGGCRMIFFGVESGSEDVLELMNKGGTQTPGMVLQLAKRLAAVGIVPEFSFVLGAPSSDVGRDIDRDIRYIRQIKETNPQSEIIIYVYSPVSFDDAELFQRARSHGFSFPTKLTDWLDPKWMNFDLRKNPNTPWLKPEHVDRIMDFERVLNARFPTISDIKLRAWQVAVLKALGSWRYRVGFYKAPFEIRFVANRLFKYRQPEIEGF
jgi:anaerobic magnesium-protoporphyrin IX monomethyl ester cyclase